MYIISAVLEKDRSEIALFNKEYKLLSKKCGAAAGAAGACLDIISENGLKSSDIDYIGVAVDGAYGSAAAELGNVTGIRCLGASIIGARALGEAYASNDVDSLVMLKIDDSVECGIVIERKIFSGVGQLGGRIAHTVINYGGYDCSCGRKGCFEAYVSNSGLRRIARDSGVAGADSVTVEGLFKTDTPEANAAKKLYIGYLANGITNVINLFQPHELVLEGPFTKLDGVFMEEIMDIILREQYTHSMPNKCKIKLEGGSADAALTGAALLGR